MEHLNTFLKEIETLNIDNAILVVLLAGLGYFISKRFEKPIYRIIILALSYHFITASNKSNILLNEDIVFSVGLILPHITFIFSFIASIFTTIKNMTANTYFFFLSIYYKILRFFKWIINIFLAIKGFFSKTKKEENYSNSNYKQEDYSYTNEQSSSNSNSNNDYNNYEKESRKQRQNDDFRNSSNSDEYSSYENNDSNQNYEDYTQNESYEKVEDNENISDEFKRFYSPSAYIILGVNESDDFSHIKKSYRALVAIYHPDKNLDEIELYTEITQNINSAYDKLKNIHGK